MAKNRESQTPAADENPTAAATPTAPESPAKAKRESKGEHTYFRLNDDGTPTVVEAIEEATGIAYKDVATGESFAYAIPGAVAGSVLTMFAIFGAKTRATNAASAARQKRERDSAYVQSDIDYIRETFAETIDGTWAVTGDGARAPAYDLDVLADVLVDLIGKATGKTQDKAKVKAKLESDLKYRRGATGNTDVKVEYLRRVGKSGGDLNSLAID